MSDSDFKTQLQSKTRSLIEEFSRNYKLMSDSEFTTQLHSPSAGLIGLWLEFITNSCCTFIRLLVQLLTN